MMEQSYVGRAGGKEEMWAAPEGLRSLQAPLWPLTDTPKQTKQELPALQWQESNT